MKRQFISPPAEVGVFLVGSLDKNKGVLREHLKTLNTYMFQKVCYIQVKFEITNGLTAQQRGVLREHPQRTSRYTHT